MKLTVVFFFVLCNMQIPRSLPSSESTGCAQSLEVKCLRYAGPNGVKLVVTSRNGFPPISGLEAWQITVKSAFVGMTLLDRPDNRIVVACGSKVFQQTPAGEILYPGPQVFTSAGLKLSTVAGPITPDNTDLDDLVQGGGFSGVCTAAAGQYITATFNVQQGEPYMISFFWAESQCAAFGCSSVESGRQHDEQSFSPPATVKALR